MKVQNSVVDQVESVEKEEIDLTQKILTYFDGHPRLSMWREEYAKPVLWDGDLSTAKVIFIGEAPGTQEQADLRPFVGKSGQLLRYFAQRFISPLTEHIVFMNPVFYYPVRPEFSLMDAHPSQAMGFGRPPTEAELRECYPMFREMMNIILHNPHPVVYLFLTGTVAYKSFVGWYRDVVEGSGLVYPNSSKGDLGLERNSVRVFKVAPNKYFVVAYGYHPSFYLRRGQSISTLNRQYQQLVNRQINLEERYFIPDYLFLLNRMKYIGKVLNHIAVRKKLINKDVRISVVKSTDKMPQSLFAANIIAFDVETLSTTFDQLEITDLSLFDGQTAYYFDLMSLNTHKEEIRKLFLSKDKLFIAHNASFDITALCKLFGEDFLYSFRFEHVFDTMIAWHLIDEESPKGLKYLADFLLDVKMTKYEAANKNRNSSQWVQYSLQDSIQAFNLFYVLDGLLDQLHLREVFEREMKALGATVAMTYFGVRIDKDALKKVKQRLLQEIQEKIENMNSIIKRFGGVKLITDYNGISSNGSHPLIDLNSPLQLYNFIYKVLLKNRLTKETLDKLGISKKKSGILPTDSSTLEKLEPYDVSGFISSLRRYRKLMKLLSAYVEPLEKEHIQYDGRVHGWFKPAGTKTGRYSSENPNMQQIPAEDEVGLRSLFVADPGYKIVAMDYSGQELRLAAVVSKEETMVQAFKEGRDLHLATAKEVFNLPIPDEALIETDPSHSKYKELYKKDRKKAKAVNFGVIYGITELGLSEQLKTSKEEAKKIIDLYFRSKPMLKKSIKDTHTRVVLDSYVVNLFGRQRHFSVFGSHTLRQAFNFKIQSSGADIMKIILGRLWKEVFVPLRDIVKPVATVHDEVVFQVREDKVEEIVNKVKSIMEDFDFVVKLEVEAGVGDNYGEAK